MSTRSGKRIHHNSFHENTMKLETDFTRSERKTRSKHTKENDELDVSRKLMKRNYVAYPADDEAGGVDTVDSKVVEKSTRALRKNALRERNIPSYIESVDPASAVGSRKSMRSTRKTRKFDENSQDEPEVIPQYEEPSKTEITKPKKGKKKVEKEVEEEKNEKVRKEVKVTKKKIKKKKGRRSGSIIVEDMELEAASTLNKSNMSVDSFHSAAGSPLHSENCEATVPVPPKSKKHETIKYSTPESHSIKAESRKTRSSVKLNNSVTKESVSEKEPKRRKSSVKLVHENSLEDVTLENIEQNLDNICSRESLKHKLSIKGVSISEDSKNSTFDLEKPNTSITKSVRNTTFEKTATPTKINTTFDKDESKATPTQKQERKSIVKAILHVNDDLKEPAEENVILEMDSVTKSGNTSKKIKSSDHTLMKLNRNSSFQSASKDKKKARNDTTETDFDEIVDKKMSTIDAELNLTDNSPFKASPTKLLTAETNINSLMDATFEKELEIESKFTQEKKMSIVDMTFELTSSPFKSANEVSSPVNMTHENDLKRKSVINTTYEKDLDTKKEIHHETSIANATFDKGITQTKINTTYEKDSKDNTDIKHKRMSLQITQKTRDTEINSTFDIDQKKLDSTFDKNSKSSLISSEDSMITFDKSDGSSISITSDESKNEENILNTTPVLIESSMEVSVINATITPTKESTRTPECLLPVTPLKREGTFTKDEPEVMGSPKANLQTPTKRMSLPSPGFTPFHVKSTKEKSVLLNVTRSIEKRRSSMADLPRATKVMFCSPVNNPAVVAQNRRKVIKSNLKGSNKSFVFDESVSLESRPRASRKRSYTQSDAAARGDLQQRSVERLSRPRTSSASAKLTEPTTPSKRATTPSKKSDAKQSRTKLPNFAALHQKQFDKMESLDECQERRAKRAKQLLTPTGAVTVLQRISPKDKAAELEKPKEAPEKSKEAPKKPETPIKSLPTLKSLNPGYTRFGFKLNLDVNPFSIPSKTLPKPKENKPNCLNRQPTPSLAGATSLRRKVAKQTAMREILHSSKRNVERIENRTVIKGVRTNRRFELQMRMRDI